MAVDADILPDYVECRACSGFGQHVGLGEDKSECTTCAGAGIIQGTMKKIVKKIVKRKKLIPESTPLGAEEFVIAQAAEVVVIETEVPALVISDIPSRPRRSAREEKLLIRLSTAEFDELERRSTAQGMPKALYLRKRAIIDPE